jgi:hypothetical protein
MTVIKDEETKPKTLPKAESIPKEIVQTDESKDSKVVQKPKVLIFDPQTASKLLKSMTQVVKTVNGVKATLCQKRIHKDTLNLEKLETAALELETRCAHLLERVTKAVLQSETDSKKAKEPTSKPKGKK